MNFRAGTYCSCWVSIRIIRAATFLDIDYGNVLELGRKILELGRKIPGPGKSLNLSCGPRNFWNGQKPSL